MDPNPRPQDILKDIYNIYNKLIAPPTTSNSVLWKNPAPPPLEGVQYAGPHWSRNQIHPIPLSPLASLNSKQCGSLWKAVTQEMEVRNNAGWSWSRQAQRQERAKNDGSFKMQLWTLQEYTYYLAYFYPTIPGRGSPRMALCRCQSLSDMKGFTMDLQILLNSAPELQTSPKVV